jgi:O-antigen/teichoic acid export membrane protein
VPRQQPVTLLAAAALVALEAVGLLAAALFFVVELGVADADDRVRASVAAVLTLLGAVGLGLVARGLFRRRRWARAPALVPTRLVLPVAFDLTRGGRWYVGVPLLLLAVVVLVLLFVRPTDEALQED